MRKFLAILRERAAARGVSVDPFTNTRTGGYSGFSLTWAGTAQAELRGLIADVEDKRGKARMFVTNERDLIQKQHALGEFYEREELDLIARQFSGGTYVDIGANVGNHAVYAGALLGAEKMHVFEPNPEAFRVLEVNIALNGLNPVTTIHPVALSDAEGSASMTFMTNNLGAARLQGGESGDGNVRLARGDDILAGEQVDFIKIDVEGHELKVLAGLENVLRGQRPAVFVEVEDENIAAAQALMAEYNYNEAETV